MVVRQQRGGIKRASFPLDRSAFSLTDSAEGSRRAGCTLPSSLQTRVLIYSGLGWTGDETER